MPRVMFFGIVRIELKIKETVVQGSNINEVLKNISLSNNIKVSTLKRSMIFLNDVNINELKGFKTKVKEDDVIMLLSPSSGG